LSARDVIGALERGSCRALALARIARTVAAAEATAIDTGARCLVIEQSEISSHRNG